MIPPLVACNFNSFYSSDIYIHSRNTSTATAPAPSPHSVTQQDTVNVPPSVSSSISAGSLAVEEPTWASIKGMISYPTLRALTDRPYSFKTMTPVQAEVVKLLPELAQPIGPSSDESPKLPRDLLVKAKTGTGKTFAFLIPAIEARLNAIAARGKQAVRDAGLVSDKHLEGRAKRQFTREHVGALIISPTRELATQIANTAIELSHHHDLEVRLFFGGGSKRHQMREFMKGRRDIVVATPGRLRDLLQSEPEVANGIGKCKMVATPHVPQYPLADQNLLSLYLTRRIRYLTWASGTILMLS